MDLIRLRGGNPITASQFVIHVIVVERLSYAHAGTYLYGLYTFDNDNKAMMETKKNESVLIFSYVYFPTVFWGV